jgi:hypothetical protein
LTENQYHQLCEACNEILQIQDNSEVRVAIPWLHVIREHPVILSKYEDLFFIADPLKDRLRRLFFRKAVWYRQIVRTFKSNGQLWFGSDAIPEKVDYLFISYLLNEKQYSQSQDFYFGSVPIRLIDKGRSVVIASISHFSGHANFFKDNFVSNKVPRLFFSESLNLSGEVKIRQMLKKESQNLKELSKREKMSLKKRILYRASKEALGGETHNNLRLGFQIYSLVKKLNPKAIVLPYEGHAFERIVFASARKYNLSIKCISYQHASVFRLSNAICRTLAPQFNPDIIFASGTDSKLALENAPDLKDIPIKVLGSERGISNIEPIPFAETKSTNYACLVLPEGVESECNKLFKFSLLCAEMTPEITYIWRLHPILSFQKLQKRNFIFKNLPSNVILSSDTIENDIAKSSWALYRGSTAIYKAISQGLRPIYLSEMCEMTIDPLYKMTKWRMVIETPNEFIACVKNDIISKMFFHKINLNFAREVCENQFSKVNIDLLDEIISY